MLEVEVILLSALVSSSKRKGSGAKRHLTWRKKYSYKAHPNTILTSSDMAS